MPTRVLLADDHALIRQGLKALLEKQGIQVVTEASDGQEAVRLGEKAQADVAILDITMPLLNGVDAARELIKSTPKTKVILLTQHDEDQYVTEALRSGVKGYVLKSQAAEDCGGRLFVEDLCFRRSSFYARAPSPSVGWRGKVDQGYCGAARNQHKDCGIPPRQTYAETRHS